MIVRTWKEVRAKMRSRKLVEVITETRGVRVQTVRRSGMPQTICVPHEAGPVPLNFRDVQREVDTAFTARRAPVDRKMVFAYDETVDGDLNDEDRG